jgi:hypothetical protein
MSEMNEHTEHTTPTLTLRKKSAHPAGYLGLTAKSVKLTLVVDPATLTDLVVPSGSKRPRFLIHVADRKLSGDLNPKSLRKVIATVTEHGPDNVAVLVQGKLGAKDGQGADVITEAGIVAQIRTPTPAC